jgi:hypothetical protein
VADLAYSYAKPTEKASVARAFGRMWGPPVSSTPTGLGACPYRASFGGNTLLTGGCTQPPTGQPAHFVSSFAILFDSFLCAGFRNASFYRELKDSCGRHGGSRSRAGAAAAAVRLSDRPRVAQEGAGVKRSVVVSRRCNVLA